MARDDAGAAARGADERLDEVGGGWVEVGARLVEQQQLGVVQHRAGHRQALHHPARVGVDAVVGAAAQADVLEQLLDRARARRRAGARGSAGSRAR